MKRSGTAKFPNSIQLFKFCQKILSLKQGGKANDQDVGSILEFNPSDCSHWKRGEKNVRSVFALAKLAETLNVETSLIHDIASGAADLDEAYFDYLESGNYKNILKQCADAQTEELNQTRTRVEKFVASLHEKCEFRTAPFYLPEVLRCFPFITAQPAEILDKLSRVLRLKPGHYAIHFKKGDLKSQTRLSMAKDIGRIVLQAERSRFPELGTVNTKLIGFEESIFAASLMLPKSMMMEEMAKLDSRRNVVADISALFWVPKSLVCFQLQDILRQGETAGKIRAQIKTTETLVPHLTANTATTQTL